MRNINVLHYLMTKSEDRHVAHCLDLDIVVSAPDLRETERRLDLLVRNYLEKVISQNNLSALNTAAPPEYWELYFSGKAIDPQPPTLRLRLPESGEIGILAKAA